MRLERTIIGMVHLPPLPGSPRWDGAMARVVALALADAHALVAAEVRRALPRTLLGVNVLKNDARAALAVAAAVGAEFIRVNVHAGAVLADQGIVQAWTLTRMNS